VKGNRIKGRTWLFLCAALLIIVHVLFKIPAPFPWLEHVWDAGDLIAFVGTIVLGYVAYWQTGNANETNDRLLKIEEARYKLDLRPFVMVSDYSAYIKNNFDIITNPDKTYIMVSNPDNDHDEVLCVEFSLLNTTNSYVSAKYSDAIFSDSDRKWAHCLPNQKDDIVRLQPSESKPLVLYAPPAEFTKLIGEKIKLRFILENRISERYAEYFYINIIALNGNIHGYSPTGIWYISMFVQEYSISRFEKDKEGKQVEIQEESTHG
jgi:hypothetical protein